MISYCVKQNKKTKCVPRSKRVVKVKNGRSMIFCTCAECGITKSRFAEFTELPENKLALHGVDGRRLVLTIRQKNGHNKEEILDQTKEGNSYANGEKSQNW